MRKITDDAIRAFRFSQSFRKDNTEVKVTEDCTILKLHGNAIAKKYPATGDVYISNAGWDSRTTYERLNGLPNVQINVRKGITYLNGEAWDGSWKQIQ